VLLAAPVLRRGPHTLEAAELLDDGEAVGAVNSFGRVVLTICMLLGRLEIFTALALLSPAFWKR